MAFSLLVALGCGPVTAQAVSLRGDRDYVEDPAHAGYYQLHWKLAQEKEADAPRQGDQGTKFELVESLAGDFEDSRAVYHGIDVATTISGKPDGKYHYRVRVAGDDKAGTQPGPWSAPLTVSVRHHSMAQALTWLIIGACVFLATLAVIILGHRKHGAGDEQVATAHDQGGE